ncbi:hypothetical protein [Marinomonas mediterranea]|jgi:hypothetical protein|uniref:Surface presentation of antigens (SPOA) protein n=1 Tax=Marinomonas mediterranea (strain ATCC 700492 / JCM 21426 / NBRC 103028 / MMB-1) TaxID=717774 RepID=F2JTD0_MARM1|nr:hypothetical protein [Marinomonas mediterranea]ADZ90348.1 hypothetical protein Marme_1073 [Marinomonas mediterranea MMB-1]WCN16532.1 hypothetical protein GV053_05430 [Marinomonas mediterranea MMB-1]
MTAFLNSLTSITKDEQLRRSQIGLGLQLSSPLINTPNAMCQFQLSLASPDMSKPTLKTLVCLQTKLGKLYIPANQAEPFLNALSSTPFTLISEPETEQRKERGQEKKRESIEHQWFTELYVQNLDPLFLSIFGDIHQSRPQQDDMALLSAYELNWKVGELTGLTRLFLNDHVLNHLLTSGNWHYDKSHHLGSLALSIPVTLGSTSLTHSELSELHKGDILVLEDQTFDVSGSGVLSFPTHTFAVSAIDNGTNQSFQVTHINKGS